VNDLTMEFHALANIFPLLEGCEFDDLVADIESCGVKQAIITHDAKILDGRNRWRAYQVASSRANVPLPLFENYEGDDPLSLVISLNMKRRHMTESQRAMVAAKLANMRQGERTDLASIEAMSQADAADKMRVSRSAVQRATKVQTQGTPEVIAAVESGEITVSDAATIVDRPADTQNNILISARENFGGKLQKAARRKDINDQRDAIANDGIILPVGEFEVIVIDPPWPYRDGIDQADYDPAGHRASNPYPEMMLSELADLQLPAADNCVLWLWTTHRFMRHAFPLLDKWGFQDRAILTWAKDRMGLGRWLRSQSEFCIMATKGSPAIDLTNQTTILHGPMREHSRKPDEFYRMVESLCIGRRLDFFSRESREGWAQIGNETEKFAS
jgi:N6-adenosine-specific RNA methylase IME4/predicted DNA-binding protein (UPF0251 family)